MNSTLRKLAASGALFVLNDSGGKDSQAMRIALRGLIPREQMVVVHASLGDVEWPGALEHAQEGAARDGLVFIVARSVKTFFQMVEHRFATRPDAPSWPSAKHRQCTSDLKRGPIEREIRKYASRNGFRDVVNCMGIRAEESSNRAKLSPFKRNESNSIAPRVGRAKHNKGKIIRPGRHWFDWLPIFDLSRFQVFGHIEAAGEEPHEAYKLGNERLSCMFCIMGSRNDLRNAALNNPSLYRRYVETERHTGYTMHQSRLSLEQLTGVPIGGAA